MRKITVDIGLLGRVLSQSESIVGYGGEHNAVSVCFGLDAEAMTHFGGAEYYRVIAEGQYSDKLYSENNSVSYVLPQSVMIPPSIHCQLVGYTELNGELSLVAKSEVAELKIGFSEVPYEKMNTEPDVFEKAVADCSNYSEVAKQNAEISQSNAESVSRDAELTRACYQLAVESADYASRSAAKAESIAEQVGEVANALKGSASGAEVTLKDISPLEHSIKVKLLGEGVSGGGLKQGELIGTVSEVWDESIMNHSWQNEGELGSFSVYQNYVPVDNRTDLYVNIPAFAGASAGLLVTDGTVYRTYRACGYEGGEVYCRIENGEIYISYNGTQVINYSIEPNAKIIGVSCNGENFANNELTLYACEMGSGVKLYKGGKNLVKPGYYSPPSNTGGMEITLNPDGSVTFNGTAEADKWFYFYTSPKLLKLPKGKYFLSGCPKGGGTTTYRLACSKGNDLGNGLAFELTTDTDLALNFFVAKGQTFNNVTIRPQVEMGSVGTEWEPYIEPTECVVNTDGTANVPSRYPSTRLFTDTDGVTIEAEYNRDINKAFAELQQAVAGLSTLAVAVIPENGGDGL